MQGNEKVEERKAEALEGKGRRKGWEGKAEGKGRRKGWKGKKKGNYMSMKRRQGEVYAKGNGKKEKKRKD